MNTEPQWSKRFDEKFKIFEQVDEMEVDGTFAIEADRNRVKSFISSLLQEQREEMKRWVQGMSFRPKGENEQIDNYMRKKIGYDKAMQDILTIINKE